MSDWIGVALILAVLFGGCYACSERKDRLKFELLKIGYKQDNYGNWNQIKKEEK